MNDKVMIGLEVHAQLNTKTKLFCPCQQPRDIDKPNTKTCPICLGLPGSKPSLNEKAVKSALVLALALDCKIPKKFAFSRKTYFYPDLAKNFQITQYEMPIALSGFLKIPEKQIRVRRIQLEEDPASLRHEKEYSLVDYNRSGVPLCEIVTEPDFATPAEARKFLEKLSTILEYIRVFDSKINKLRVDANVSVGAHARAEVKNITSYKDVEKALGYEIMRQKVVLQRGEENKQETRLFDSKTGTTKSTRSKETEEEYGYIFEPDLPIFETKESLLEDLKKNMPELPEHRAIRLSKEFGINDMEAAAIVSELKLADFFESLAKKLDSKLCARWISVYLKKVLNYNSLRFSETNITENQLREFLNLISSGEISQRGGDLLLRELVLKPQKPKLLAQKLNLLALDDKALSLLVKKVVGENKDAVLDYKSGKEEALKYLIGQVIRESKGKADAVKAEKIIKQYL